MTKSILAKTVSLLLAAVLCLSVIPILKLAPLTASAAVSGDFGYSLLDGEATITEYFGDDEEIIVPSEIDGYPVTAIGENSFVNHSSLISIVLPNGIKVIFDWAFGGCENLVNIEIPASVKWVGYCSFYNTGYYNDESNWEDDVLYLGSFLLKAKDSISGNYEIKDGTTVIAKWAFEACTELTGVTMPEGLETVGEFAFDSCENLNNIAIPDTVSKVGYEAFYNTGYYNDEANWEGDLLYIGKILLCVKDSFSGELVIKDGTLVLADYALESCFGVTSVVIPESLTVIGDYAFFDCTVLTSYTVSPQNANYSSLDGVLFNKDETILIDYPYYKDDEEYAVPDSVTKISGGAFMLNENLLSVEIPDSVKIIGSEAFSDCIALQSVTIGQNVEIIGEYAFVGCIALESITIPSSVYYIGIEAFAYSDNLTDIIVSDDNECFASEDGTLYNKSKTKILYCACGKAGEYTVAESVTEIGDYAFDGCFGLSGITVYYNVKNIGEYAFGWIEGLVIYTPKNSTAYYYAIQNNQNVEIIPTQDEENFSYYISDKTAVVTGCANSVGDVVIPATLEGWPVTEIAGEAFVKCKDMTSISIPETVTFIGAGAFMGCKGLTEITLPEGITSVSENTFSECTALQSITMSENITMIGSGAFYHCSNLLRIDIPNSEATIGKGAFEGCDNLTIYALKGSNAHYYAKNNGIKLKITNPEGIIDVMYDYYGDKIIFYVVTGAGDYNRVKVALADNPSGSLAVSSSCVETYEAECVWTIKIPVPDETTQYAFDIRNSDNKYLKDYYNFEVQVDESAELYKSVSHEIKDGKIIFKVVTSPGEYNRIKATLDSNLKGSIAVGSYTVNSNGNYIWTIKAPAPTESTRYAFDIRNNENNYLRQYYYYDVDVVEQVCPIKSVTHEFVGNKLVFTVATVNGAFNRVKAALAEKPTGSLGVGDKYAVDLNGDYIWTVKVAAPKKTTQYAFDIRDVDGKYVKYYFNYEVVPENMIKSAECAEENGKLVFTVVTKAGDFNRLRCGLSTSTKDNLSSASTYYVDENGDYVWTVKIAKPEENTTLYFDLRDSNTNMYIKDFYVFDYEA